MFFVLFSAIAVENVEEIRPHRDVDDGEGYGEPQGHVEKLFHVHVLIFARRYKD